MIVIFILGAVFGGYTWYLNKDLANSNVKLKVILFSFIGCFLGAIIICVIAVAFFSTQVVVDKRVDLEKMSMGEKSFYAFGTLRSTSDVDYKSYMFFIKDGDSPLIVAKSTSNVLFEEGHREWQLYHTTVFCKTWVRWLFFFVRVDSICLYQLVLSEKGDILSLK